MKLYRKLFEKEYPELNLRLEYLDNTKTLYFKGNKTPKYLLKNGNIANKIIKRVHFSLQSYSHPQIDIDGRYIQLYIGGTDSNPRTFCADWYIGDRDNYPALLKLLQPATLNKQIKVL